MSPKLRVLIGVVAVVLPLDQLSKLWIAAHISPFAPMPLIPGFFQLTHARNPGMAFGLWQGVPSPFFIAVTLIALVLIAGMFRGIDREDRLSAVSLGLIIAGALGNLADRLIRGEVIDFLQFDLRLFIFPDFNLADSAIVIGVGIMLLDQLIPDRTPAPDPGESSPAPGTAGTAGAAGTAGTEP